MQCRVAIILLIASATTAVANNIFSCNYQTSYATCPGRYRQECVPTVTVCDGKNDCPNHVDEDESRCAECTEKYPIVDGISCKSQSECYIVRHHCHGCKKKLGTGKFKCLCNGGYRVADSGGACRLQDDSMLQAMVLVGNEIVTVNISHHVIESSSMPLMSWESDTIDTVYKVKHGNRFVGVGVSKSTKTMFHMSTNGAAHCMLSNMDTVRHVAVSGSTGHFYYVHYHEASRKTSLDVCDPTMKYCRQLFAEGDHGVGHHLLEIEIHDGRNRIYYVFKEVSTSHHRGIASMSLDGADHIVHKRAMQEGSTKQRLIVDEAGDALYWLVTKGENDNQVYMMRIGEGKIFWVQQFGSVQTVDGFAIGNGQLYAINPATLVSMTLDKHGTATIVHQFNTTIYGAPTKLWIINNDHSLAAKRTNPCAAGKCSHICVLSKDHKPLCLCPHGYGWSRNDHGEHQCEPWSPNLHRILAKHPHICDERRTRECNDGSMCQNGGDCDADFTVKQVCMCPKGYDGIFCEVQIGEIEYGGNSTAQHVIAELHSHWPFYGIIIVQLAIVVAQLTSKLLCGKCHSKRSPHYEPAGIPMTTRWSLVTDSDGLPTSTNNQNANLIDAPIAH